MRTRTLVPLVFGLLWASARPAPALPADRAIDDLALRFFHGEHGLPQESVLALAQTGDGYLWAATVEGLARFDGVAFTPEGNPRRQVLSLATDAGGTLWIGTNGGGLLRRGHRELEPVRGLAIKGVTAIYPSADGALWLGSWGVLLRGRGDQFVQMPLPEKTDLFAHVIAGDAGGRIWLGTHEGLRRVHDGVPAALDGPAPTKKAVLAIAGASDGTLWLGTEGDGLVSVRDGRVITRHTRGDGLPSDEVAALMVDRAGTLWIGTSQGLARLREGRVETRRRVDDLRDAPISALLEDREGNLWIGTRGRGLARLRDVAFRTLGTREGLPGDALTAMAELPDGTMLMGTRGQGLVAWKDGVVRRVTSRDGLASDEVSALLVDDGAGQIWVGHARGQLSRGKVPGDGEWRLHGSDGGLPPFRVRGLARHPRGGLLVGMEGGGLLREREGRFHPMDAGSPEARFIERLAVDGAGRVWVAALQRLFQLDDQDRLVDRTPTVPGRATIGARDIVPGHDGVLWMAAAGSLCLLSGQETIVDPRRVPAGAPPPPPVLEAVLVDGVDRPVGEALTVPAGTRSIEIRYTAPALGAPERLRFRHRLRPFDPGWIEAGARRHASYTSLPPGSYEFTVAVAGEDGSHQEASAVLRLQQLPRLHQRASFWWALVALALALALAAHRARTRIIRQQMMLVLSERSRIARELHDTLLQGMVGMMLQLEGFATRLAGATALRDPFEKMLGGLRQAVEEARGSIADLRSADAGTLLPERLAQTVAQAAAGAPRKPHVHVTGSSAPLPPEVEAEILRIAQEAVTNSLRHAEARDVHVGLSLGPDRVTLRVRDDGRGFDPAAPPPEGHFGLVGIRERAARIRAALDVRSTPGRGTEIVVDWRAP